MALVPIAAGGVALYSAVTNGIIAASGVLDFYQQNQAVIDAGYNQLAQAIEDLAERVPRPPPGQRLRINNQVPEPVLAIQTPPKQRPFRSRKIYAGGRYSLPRSVGNFRRRRRVFRRRRVLLRRY